MNRLPNLETIMDNRKSSIPSRYARRFGPMEDQVMWSHQAQHDQLNAEIPMQPVLLNGDYTPLTEQGFTMLPDEWFNTSSLADDEPESNRETFEEQQKAMYKMAPKWATDFTKAPSPAGPDEPLR